MSVSTTHSDIPITPPYAYSRAEIERIRTRIYLGNFSVPQGFFETDGEVLAQIYNGVGPEHWSARFRRFTSWVLDFLEASALIHDWEYTFQEKRYGAFTVANLRLAKNAARDGHFLAGLAAALLCQFFGWRAWKEGSRFKVQS